MSKYEYELKNLDMQIKMCKEKMKNPSSKEEKKKLVDTLKNLTVEYKQKQNEYKKIQKQAKR